MFCRIVVDTFGDDIFVTKRCVSQLNASHASCIRSGSNSGVSRANPHSSPKVSTTMRQNLSSSCNRSRVSKGMKIGAGVSTIVSPDFHQRRKVRQHLPASDFSGVSARRCWGSCTSAFRRRAQEIPNRNPPAENASAGHLSFVVSLEIFPRVFHLGLGNSREIIGATQNRYLLYWIC